MPQPARYLTRSLYEREGEKRPSWAIGKNEPMPDEQDESLDEGEE